MTLPHTLSSASLFARRVSDGLSPKYLLFAVFPLTGAHGGRVVGVGWGLLAAVVFVVPPSFYVRAGVRRGRWTDRHLSVRTQRAPVAVGLSLYVTAVVILLAAVGADQAVSAVAFTLAALCAATTALTAVWKVSVHCTVAGAFATVLGTAYGALGAWLVVVAPLVALIGWSRLQLRAHSFSQVAVGCLLGTAGSATLWPLADTAGL
ncbi:hypothetical protein [Streptodolium elevatio]